MKRQPDAKNNIISDNGNDVPKKTLGPVRDLEEHVKSEWWKEIFNHFYLMTDSDVVDDERITKKEIGIFLDILQPQENASILDLCCGQGRHTIELAGRGFTNVEGLDRSHYLIHKARRNARKKGLSIKFREGDARKLPYANDSFDYVLILGNSFGYFEVIQDDIKVLREVFRVLKPWGKVLMDVADGSFLRRNYQPRSWEWLDKVHFVCRERSLSKDAQRLISREVINHIHKGVIADQFYAERLYTEESLHKVLDESSFSQIQFHQTIAPESQRNQDLGMMEQRFIITSVVRKKWSPQKRKSKKILKTIAVLMGDPARPDITKPSSVFDEDDFYTIDQLKGALRELKEYRFLYFSNHDTMMDDLKGMRGKIDLIMNLCDEGLYNDPRKELHVPAMLEYLGIPYTGSGPQCLAFCYDKSLVRGIAKEMQIPVPEAFFIKPEDLTFDLSINFPAIVKPNFGDSSFGITQKSVVYSVDELLNAISEVKRSYGYEKPILVEEFLTGSDLTVGIIGNYSNSFTVLPILEEDYSALPANLPRLCGYEAKWDPKSPYWNLKSIPAQISKEAENEIVGSCLKLFERLECRDYVRFDWRLNERGEPKLLEVNPNPGWCWDGHLAKMVKLSGMNYTKMLKAILAAAEQRLESQS